MRVRTVLTRLGVLWAVYKGLPWIEVPCRIITIKSQMFASHSHLHSLNSQLVILFVSVEIPYTNCHNIEATPGPSNVSALTSHCVLEFNPCLSHKNKRPYNTNIIKQEQRRTTACEGENSHNETFSTSNQEQQLQNSANYEKRPQQKATIATLLDWVLALGAKGKQRI